MVMSRIYPFSNEFCLQIVQLAPIQFRSVSVDINTNIGYSLPGIGYIREQSKVILCSDMTTLRNILENPDMNPTSIKLIYESGTMTILVHSREVKINGPLVKKEDFLNAGLMDRENGIRKVEFVDTLG
jgi:hypothetical protein